MAAREISPSGAFECPICYKHYAIRSSYVRHSRQCLERRVSSSRQKSCRQCSNTKVRCDKSLPACSRCAARGHTCEYATVSSDPRRVQVHLRRSPDRGSFSSSSLEDNHSDLGLTTQPCSTPIRGADCVKGAQSGGLVPNTQCDDKLVIEYSPSVPLCQSERILLEVEHEHNQSRAARSADVQVSPHIDDTPAPPTGRHSPTLDWKLHSQAQQPAATECLTFLTRIFRTYPRMMSRREQLPPFIHESQTSSENISVPLANCFALSRMWESSNKGAASKCIVESSIRREMEKHFIDYRSYDAATLVAAFQSVLIYAIILLFPDPQNSPSRMLDLSTLIALREFAFYVSQGNLVLPEEKLHTRPLWKDWVLICCKRRTLLCLNMFNWLNAMHNGFANFPCAEPDCVPAPTGKVLWNITSEERWTVAYDRWLGHWAGMSIYTLLDLNNVGFELDPRSEMWLEEADELGLILVALKKAK